MHKCLHVTHHGGGTGLGRTRRQLHADDVVTHVFGRNEGFRHACIGQAQPAHNGDVDEHVAARALDQPLIEQRKALGQLFEVAIEPAEKAFLVFMVPLGDGLEQRGTQCGREGQRQQAREQDGHRQRQRELPVDHAHRTAHEGQRQEHRHQHQGDADDGT